MKKIELDRDKDCWHVELGDVSYAFPSHAAALRFAHTHVQRHPLVRHPE